jgi:hypothetical protein
MPPEPSPEGRLGGALRQERFYKDILDGLSLVYDSALINDIRNTALLFPASELGNALNKKQTACKLWLVDALHDAIGGEIGAVHVLGGWYGVLAAMLLNDRRFEIGTVVNFDLDPACEAVANSLNATRVAEDRFLSLTANIYDLDYGGARVAVGAGNGAASRELPVPDVLINTSCEHLDDFAGWFGRLPEGMLLVLQTNDYYGVEGHVNCVETLAEFKAQTPLSKTLFEGELKLERYTRFMLIGRK